MSDFGGAHLVFRLIITCVVHLYGFLLRTLSPNICRPYLVVVDTAVRTAVLRILGISRDVQTRDNLNYVKCLLSLPAEFGGLMYRPLSLTLNLLTML
jgi:hypothetical protein